MIVQQPSPVAVVGAGPGGLAAAILLASSGVRVVVYEARDTIGGRTSRITDRGYSFDRGPTFFLMPYVLEEIFAAAGRSLTDYVELTRLDPMYRLLVADEQEPDRVTRVDATQNVEAMAAQLARLDPRDGAAFGEFVRENRVKLDRMTPILRSSIRSPLDLLSLSTARVGPMLHPHLSVHGYLSKRFHHPASRLALSFQSKYLGMSPHDCPSLFSILPFIEYEYGVWSPRSGCAAIMDAMAELASELGVEIRTSTPAEKILTEGGRVTGVRVAGEDHRHEHVVVNADGAWAMRNLLDEADRPKAWRDGAIDRKKYSCSTYMMYLGVDGEVDLPYHTIFISSKYRENLERISETGGLADDPSVYICNPSTIDPTMAPPGKSSLYVLMPVSNASKPGQWTELDAPAREACLGQLERRFGITGIRDRIEVEHRISPADWQAENIHLGATFNLAHNLGQMLHRRVPHELPTTRGVWFVGGATHPGSGLPVIWLSSQITANLLCERLGVPAPGATPPQPAALAPA